ncbi:MAG TPA: amino acid ABC transporter substrate-binding protein [Bacillus bacterium]|uniref:Amino acid ABC transporter substrate-binding protein n=1 Tax=Siminovitchia fordii TaxID=254759 RepID=A0ABQ4KAH2_9BACI|nr:transporter substrate-binding domain-containing protein [Siminovitchia fordii]GIN22733.1 amino acid ABC transporter substrate-binding protein [Siminovitchia fordii]HBZ11920.1 amino acid ABC transporter substrate-binding protein [Bacillus sp. (in: firmicutes)]
MKKLWAGAVALLGFIFIISGCSQSTAKESDDGKKVVKIAISDEVNPPFLYADENNEPIGYDIDYLKEVEKKLPDYKFEYIWGEEESNLVGVDTGKYDFAINWFFKNPERQEKFLYPEHEFGYSLTSLVTKKDRDDIKTLDDMVGKKFPPVSPSGGLRAILNSYNDQHPDDPLTLESMDSPSNAENLKMVDKGKADAMFINVTTFNEIQKELNLNLKVAGIISKEPIFTVYSKENAELAKEIDQATVELTEDGTLSKLAEKWFGVDFFQDLEYINEEGFNFEK